MKNEEVVMLTQLIMKYLITESSSAKLLKEIISCLPTNLLYT
jgi:hypothetical protein